MQEFEAAVREQEANKRVGYTQSEREQAVRVLEHIVDIFNDCNKFMWPDEKIEALNAIACLRSPGASPETDGKAGGWVRTSERLPTAADDGEYGVVLAYNKALSREDEMGLAACVRTCVVREWPEWWTYWMRLPALPELPEVDK